MSYIVRSMSVANQARFGYAGYSAICICDLLFYSLSHFCSSTPLSYCNDHRTNGFSSPSITGFIKSRRVRWVGHVVHIWGSREMRTRFWCRSLKERNNLEELRVGRRIMLKWKLKRRSWVELTWLRIGSRGGLL